MSTPRDVPGLVIGLTGGVASGKTSVSEALAAAGVRVVDTDVLARQVVAIGSPGLVNLIEAFGPDILNADGTLDRRGMRERVFADAAAKSRLEAIVHPRIHALARDAVRTAVSAYVLLVVPLLVESGRYDWVDRVVVVDIAEAVQLERLLRRDGVGEEIATAMLRAQASRAQRLIAADEVIGNSGTLEQLRQQALVAHRRYLTLASLRSKQVGQNPRIAAIPCAPLAVAVPSASALTPPSA